jgi:hypothetical protein
MIIDYTTKNSGNVPSELGGGGLLNCIAIRPGHRDTERAEAVVTLYTRIREVPGSNLDRFTINHDDFRDLLQPIQVYP